MAWASVVMPSRAVLSITLKLKRRHDLRRWLQIFPMTNLHSLGAREVIGHSHAIADWIQKSPCAAMFYTDRQTLAEVSVWPFSPAANLPSDACGVGRGVGLQPHYDRVLSPTAVLFKLHQ